MVVDITERNRSEQERQRMAALLMEEERRRASFAAQMMGITSHDLRSPLQAIALGAQMLDEAAEEGSEVARVARRIRQSSDRAVRMVRDLLDFTQARLGGGIPLERRPAELGEALHPVVEELRITYPRRELRWAHRGPVHGQWDVDRLGQVLTNLVGNAMQYSASHHPVSVTTEHRDGRAVLAVHNAGEPIAPEHLPLLFEPMHRAVSGGRTERSVGLGIFIVRQIAEGHGGRVSASSTAETGTTFTVELPAAG